MAHRLEQKTVRTLLAFHLASGLRPGLRAVAPLTVLLLALPVYLGPDFIESVARHLFPSLGLSIDGRRLTQLANPWALGATVLFLSVIAPATRALRGDFVGTLRALPFSEKQRQRALHLGSMAVAGPLAVWLLLMMIARTMLDDGRPAGLLLGIPSLAIMTVALGGFGASTPGMHRLHWGLAAAGALQTSVLGLAIALLFVGLASRSAASRTPPEPKPSSRPRPVDRKPAWPISATLLPLLWNLRVLPWSRLASAYFGAALMTLPVLFFLMNNELPPWIVTRATIFAATAASLAMVHAVHGSYDASRPPLKWERSLPWSGVDRIATDLFTLAILFAPIVLLTGTLRPAALPPALATQLLFGSRWIVHQRTRTRAVIGSPAQQLLAEGALAILLATVAPWLAIGLVVVAIWPLSRLAIRAERALRVSSWRETSLRTGRN